MFLRLIAKSVWSPQHPCSLPISSNGKLKREPGMFHLIRTYLGGPVFSVFDIF